MRLKIESSRVDEITQEECGVRKADGRIWNPGECQGAVWPELPGECWVTGATAVGNECPELE